MATTYPLIPTLPAKMKKNNHWLLVILVALTQLALLLIAEIFVFGWFKQNANEFLADQVVENNRLLVESVRTSLSEVATDGEATPSELLEQSINIVERTRVPELGLITIADARTGDLLYQTQRPAGAEVNPLDKNWGNVVLDDSTKSLLRQVREMPSDQPVSGMVTGRFANQFVAFAKAKNAPFIVIVHQLESAVTRRVEDSIASAQQVGFLLLLALGFIGSWLMHCLLRSYRNKMNRINHELESKVNERADQLFKTQNAVIFGLAKLAESRDNDTGEHLDRIRRYVTLLADDLKVFHDEVDVEFIQNLSVASSLHDIGKVGIPDSILLKPGRLSIKERSIMEMHAVIGGECLEAIQGRLGNNEFLKMATEVAYAHHERWDGTGYPHGLVGNEIPLVARIVSVADVYDALTSKRPYKRAMSHLESRDIIVAGAGNQFDPLVVEAFLRHELEFEMISIKQQFVDDEQATSSFQKLAQAVAEQTEEERNAGIA